MELITTFRQEMADTYLKKRSKPDVSEAVVKKPSEVYKKGGCPQQLQLPDAVDPCNTALKN
jgi:hypothetical protein